MIRTLLREACCWLCVAASACALAAGMHNEFEMLDASIRALYVGISGLESI